MYKAFHKDYPALVTSLEDIQLSNTGGSSKEREKANNASILKFLLINKKMWLNL